MYCTKCGNKLPDHAKFCTSCGNPVAVKMPAPEETLEEKQRKQVDEFELDIDLDSGSPKSADRSVPHKSSKAAGKSAGRHNADDSGSEGASKTLIVVFVLLLMIAVALISFIIVKLIGQTGDSDRKTVITEVSGAAVSSGPEDTEAEISTEPEASAAETAAPEVTPAASSASEAAAVTASPGTTSEPAAADSSEGYLLPGSSTEYLTEADLSSLTHEELCFARNEIFARHGRIFTTPEIAAYFAGKSWYHGTVSGDAFDDSVLNAYEIANISLISNYEKRVYGGSYY